MSRTITLQTIDHGPVTVEEPDWCLGHAGEPVGYRADIVHKGRIVAAEYEADHGPVEFLKARISWGPFGELRPEPYPVADVEEFPPMSPAQLRELVAEVHLHADRLDRLADELDRLRRAES
ncbi:DUF6907 domain-containing protein [Streptomyces sp. NPDC001435]|uniref:DUF6907 domain-containing protein n=1 Tax=Streptomyces sp. NPDC001435 TaxID=3364576 RepID=UPI0036C78230